MKLTPLALVFVASTAWAIPVTSFTYAMQGNLAPGQNPDVADAGDLNADGRSDIALGDPSDLTVGPGGSALVTWGGGLPGMRLPTIRFFGSNPNDGFGTSVDGQGDFNCDGFADFAVGAPGSDLGGIDAGAAFVWFGPIAGGTYADTSADLTLVGTVPGGQAGRAVEIIADADFDGCSDLAIGAPQTLVGAMSGAGAVYFVSSGALLPPVAPLVPGLVTEIDGDQQGGQFGFSLDGAGDFDGDGAQDLVVGAPTYPGGPGAAFVIHRPGFLPNPAPWAASPVSTRFLAEPAPAGGAFGWSVEGSRDLDLDGQSEILVGAPRYLSGGAASGAAYLISGSFVPTAPGAVLPMPGFAARFLGIPGGSTGWDVAFLGDINGDGREDWGVTSPFAPFGGGQGRTEIKPGTGVVPPAGFSGPILPSPEYTAVAGIVVSGYALDGSRDNDGDGRSDVILGSRRTIGRNIVTTY